MVGISFFSILDLIGNLFLLNNLFHNLLRVYKYKKLKTVYTGTFTHTTFLYEQRTIQ